ncbi:hypothetical protein PC116_g3442 [Phytophthora cactorum]|uniref:Uncharacterized protein n=1 Tax=Phytophthora cactorum TaxID=29920 RepID=A0A8T1EGN9_9STRA|nr:hypothetical protein PC114_g4682 [Phytophthora cactorum]KAG2950553.1 hypothetical protein PC117_g4341 [Phytophthora cactorum]KAG3036845.1 hypothetical protein PC119_g4110 [Phytophthora cactorum]KAG4248807.1 hypothetical protein PC116_g3442 [Phytophthora cactorum]
MEYEQGAENQPMDGNPSMRGPSESATQIARADCTHLSDPEWEALQRLATVIGEAAVATMLRTLSMRRCMRVEKYRHRNAGCEHQGADHPGLRAGSTTTIRADNAEHSSRSRRVNALSVSL